MLLAMEGEVKAEGEGKGHGNGVFLFADRVDVVLMVMGTVGAVGDGCSINCLLLFASGVMNSLGYGKAHSTGLDHADFMKDVEKVQP